MYGFNGLVVGFHVADAVPFPAPTRTSGSVKLKAVQSATITPNLGNQVQLPKNPTGNQICGYLNGF